MKYFRHLNFSSVFFQLIVKWKDVVTITKEKTALVIPNAIQLITVEGDKHFFTTFAARDKAFTMVDKIWQYAIDNTVGHTHGRKRTRN